MIRQLHATLGVSLALGLAVPAAAAGQQARVSAAALGHIADDVLNAVLPQERMLSRVPVSSRKIVFDLERTLAAFEKAGALAPGSRELHLRRSVQPGSARLLHDCDQAARKPCAGLGWRVYTFLQPASVTQSELAVQANVMWPDRGGEPFVQGVAPTGRTSLVGFSVKVHFVRDKAGAWKFSRVDSTYLVM